MIADFSAIRAAQDTVSAKMRCQDNSPYGRNIFLTAVRAFIVPGIVFKTQAANNAYSKNNNRSQNHDDLPYS